MSVPGRAPSRWRASPFIPEPAALAPRLLMLLGGTVGVGTVVFALLIGPSVQLGLRLAGSDRRSTLGAPRA